MTEVDKRVWTGVNVLLMRNGKVLLSRRQNKRWMNGYLCIPGGHPFPDESLQAAAVREVREELGLDVAVSRLKFLCAYPRLTGNDHEKEKVGFEFVVELHDDEEPYNAEPDMCSELLWCDPHRLPDDVIEEFRIVIERCLLGHERYFELGYTS